MIFQILPNGSKNMQNTWCFSFNSINNHIIGVFQIKKNIVRRTFLNSSTYMCIDIYYYDTTFPVLKNDVQHPTSLDPRHISRLGPVRKAMRVVKCFSLEPMALEMLSDARERELEAQWFKRKDGAFYVEM